MTMTMTMTMKTMIPKTMIPKTSLRKSLRLVSLGLLLALAAGSAAADWLRTRDGARLETRGPWRVKGTSVIFISPEGTLQSIRLSEIDLEASERLTAEALRPPAPVAEQVVVPEPVLVLTNEDVPRAAPPALPAEETDAEPGDAPPETSEKAALEVVAWRTVESPEGDGVEVVGTIVNTSRHIVTDVGVVTRLFDDQEELLGTANAFLGTTSLAPQTSTTLRALFPGVFPQEGEAKFEIRSRAVELEDAK